MQGYFSEDASRVRWNHKYCLSSLAMGSSPPCAAGEPPWEGGGMHSCKENHVSMLDSHGQTLARFRAHLTDKRDIPVSGTSVFAISVTGIYAFIPGTTKCKAFEVS